MGRAIGTELYLLPKNPTAANEASRKQYVDEQVATRAALSHVHAAGDITSGSLNPLRLPQTLWNTSNNTTTGVGSFVMDLSSVTYPYRVRIVLNHNSGVDVPSGTILDGQTVKIAAYANGAQRSFTFASGYRLSTGLSSRVFTIPSGQMLIAMVEYSVDLGAWVLTSATVSAA